MEEFINPMGLTQRDLADAIRILYQRTNDAINGRRDITSALRPTGGEFLAWCM